MAISKSNRVGTVNNLEVGGTHDLLMVKVEGDFPEGKVSFGFYDVPMKITGLQKVVQTFLKVLLTTKGSDVIYPDRGSFFPEMTVGANQLVDDNALLSDLSDAIKDATGQTRSILNVNSSDITSALDRVEILGLDRISEGVMIYLQVITLAGELAAISVPFPEFGLDGN